MSQSVTKYVTMCHYHTLHHADWSHHILFLIGELTQLIYGLC